MPLNPFLSQDHGLKVIQGKKHPESVAVLVPYIGAPARKESSEGLIGTNGCEGCLVQGHSDKLPHSENILFCLELSSKKDFSSCLHKRFHTSVSLFRLFLALWTHISSATTACLESGLRFLFITLKDSFMVCFFDFIMMEPGLHVKLLCNPIKFGMTLSYCPAKEESAAAVRNY